MECVGSTGAIPAEAPPFYGSWLHVGALYAALCGGLDSLGRTTLGYCLIGPSRGGHLCGCQLAALPVRWKAAQHLLPGTNDSASGDITPRLSWTRRGPPQGCSKLCSSCAVSSGRPTTGTDRDVESAVGESFVVMFEEQFVRCSREHVFTKIHRVHAWNVASCHDLLDTATLIASRARLRAGVDEELGVLHRRGSSEAAGPRGRSGGLRSCRGDRPAVVLRLRRVRRQHFRHRRAARYGISWTWRRANETVAS